MQLLRSVLYMPASNQRALVKAKSLDCDGIIFDLEDAVVPELKEAARHAACEAVRSNEYGYRQTIIRINALETPWGNQDLKAALSAKPDAILVPKVRTADEIKQLSSKFVDSNVKLWIMAETPQFILNCREIAAEATKDETPLTAIVLGTNDLARETGVKLLPGRTAMMSWIMTLVAAARANGLIFLDGVYNNFSDPDGYTAECEQGAECGFDGKTLIHPSQIETANKIFAPNEEDIIRANQVVSAFAQQENIHASVITIDGKMVERLHLEMAKNLLKHAELIKNRG